MQGNLRTSRLRAKKEANIVAINTRRWAS